MGHTSVLGRLAGLLSWQGLQVPAHACKVQDQWKAWVDYSDWPRDMAPHSHAQLGMLDAMLPEAE